MSAYPGLSTRQNEELITGPINDFADRYAEPLFYGQSAMAEALFEACFQSKIGFVNALISLGVCVNCRDSETDTPLIVASAIGSPGIVKALIKGAADVDAQNKYGITALMEASFWGAKKVVEILIMSGASIDLEDYAGRTALSWACAGGAWDVEARLIRLGANTRKFVLRH